MTRSPVPARAGDDLPHPRLLLCAGAVADGAQPWHSDRLAAGFISFIPYLGSFTGLVLSLCVVVLQFWPSWTMIPVVLGIFLAGQAIADYLLSPYLIASRVQLNPVWVMLRLPRSVICLASSAPHCGALAAAIGVVIRFAIRQHLFTPPEPAQAPPPQEIPPPRKNWLKSVWN